MNKVSKKIYLPWLIVTLIINFSAIGQATEMKLSPEQRKIWGLVESYWESVKISVGFIFHRTASYLQLLQP